MMRSSTSALEIQEAPAARHPSGTDKLRWIGEISNGHGLSRGAIAVASRLAVHHNSETGQCNPSLKTIAKALGTSLATIRRDLDELKEAGAITWRSGKNHRSSHYNLKQITVYSAKGSDEVQGPIVKFAPAKATPAKRKWKAKGPASSEGNVVQFPGTSPVSVPAVSTCNSSPVSTCDTLPGPEMSTCRCSPVSTCTCSPVSTKLLKENPVKGSPEREEQKELEASVSPASPLRPEGHRVEQATGMDEKKPDQQPVSQPADGKLSFDQLSPEWKAWAREWADTQFLGDKPFIDQASRGLKAEAIEKGWKLTEGRWNEVWKSYSMGENHKRPPKYPLGKGPLV